MAFYADEEDVWRCSNHPSKLRRIGICPFCLCDRLATLCPHCANVRPCDCCAASSSSSSSSFSCLIGDDKAGDLARRFSNLIDSEQAFRLSRSSSRFLWYRNSKSIVAMKSTSFWSFVKLQKNKTSGAEKGGGMRRRLENAEPKESSWRPTMMMRSRSVPVQDSCSESMRRRVEGRGWRFPSAIKAFRQSRISKVEVGEDHL